MKKKALLFFLFFSGLSFFFSRCASGGEKEEVKKLFVQASFAIPPDSQKGIYWLAFETDNDPGDAPFFSGDNLLNTSFYIALEGTLFRKVEISNNQITQVTPFTAAGVNGNMIQYSIPLSSFPALSSLDINFFSFELQESQKVLRDGLFDPHSDTRALHFNLATETTRIENDPADNLPSHLAFLDLTSLALQIVTE